MKRLLIEELRRFLSSDDFDDLLYHRLRGKLVGYLDCDGITMGEFELWNEFLYMKKWGKHSYYYIMEMFGFNK